MIASERFCGRPPNRNIATCIYMYSSRRGQCLRARGAVCKLSFISLGGRLAHFVSPEGALQSCFSRACGLFRRPQTIGSRRFMKRDRFINGARTPLLLLRQTELFGRLSALRTGAHCPGRSGERDRAFPKSFAFREGFSLLRAHCNLA